MKSQKPSAVANRKKRAEFKGRGLVKFVYYGKLEHRARADKYMIKTLKCEKGS